MKATIMLQTRKKERRIEIPNVVDVWIGPTHVTILQSGGRSMKVPQIYMKGRRVGEGRIRYVSVKPK
jgi:hypothetical protein